MQAAVNVKRLLKRRKKGAASAAAAGALAASDGSATTRGVSYDDPDGDGENNAMEPGKVFDWENEPVTASNVMLALEQARELDRDARLIVAVALLRKVEALVGDAEQQHHPQVQAAARALEREREAWDTLKQRSAACADTLSDWESPDWIFAQSYMGVSTYYKKDPTNGTLWVKLSGVMEGCNVLDQLAVVREIDLYSLWMPFCSAARVIRYLGRVELIGWLEVSMPAFVRDCVMHAYACDCILEDKCILLQSSSIDEWPGVELPEAKTTWTKDRMVIHAIKARIEMLSPTSAGTSMVANIDPKAPLPQSLINFIMKKAAGVMLYFLVRAASKIPNDVNNAHRRSIARDAEFYRDWMVPKFQYFCRVMGWEFQMPVAVLESMPAPPSMSPASESAADAFSASPAPPPRAAAAGAASGALSDGSGMRSAGSAAPAARAKRKGLRRRLTGMLRSRRGSGGGGGGGGGSAAGSATATAATSRASLGRDPGSYSSPSPEPRAAAAAAAAAAAKGAGGGGGVGEGGARPHHAQQHHHHHHHHSRRSRAHDLAPGQGAAGTGRRWVSDLQVIIVTAGVWFACGSARLDAWATGSGSGSSDERDSGSSDDPQESQPGHWVVATAAQWAVLAVGLALLWRAARRDRAQPSNAQGEQRSRGVGRLLFVTTLIAAAVHVTQALLLRRAVPEDQSLWAVCAYAGAMSATRAAACAAACALLLTRRS